MGLNLMEVYSDGSALIKTQLENYLQLLKVSKEKQQRIFIKTFLHDEM